MTDLCHSIQRARLLVAGLGGRSHDSMHRHLSMVSAIVDEVILRTEHATERDIGRARKAKVELERILRAMGSNDVEGVVSRALRTLDKANRFLEEVAERPRKESERARHPHPTTVEVVVCSHRQFCLSEQAQRQFLRLTGKQVAADGFLSNGDTVHRADAHLINVVRQLGTGAGGVEPNGWCHSQLHVANVPWNAYYVAYPCGEVVYETFADAVRDTWDWDLEMVHFRTNFRVPSEAVKAMRRLMGI